MSPLLLSIVASLLGCPPQATPPGRLSVVSPNGRFVAEAVPDANGSARRAGEVRCDLAVYELRPDGERVAQWKGLYDYRGLETGHFLGDDGSAFVHVDERAFTDRPVVRVIRRGLSLVDLDARALHIADPKPAVPTTAESGTTLRGAPAAGPGARGSDNATRWIDLGPGTTRLRDIATITNTTRYLDLLGRDGILRSIELARGGLEVSAEPGLANAPRLERGLAREALPDLAPPFVQSFSAPATLWAGEPLPVEIIGSYPTPGWELQGFDLARERGESERLVITPFARASAGPVTQVLRPLRVTAMVEGLGLGTYAVTVRGRDPAPVVADARVDVLPLGLVVMMKRGSGRSARSIALLSDGRVIGLFDHETPAGRETPARIVLAPVATVEGIARSVRELDPKGSADATHDVPRGATEFVWLAGESVLRAVREEAALEAPWRDLAAQLDELMRPEPVRHTIDGAASRLQLRTSSAGLLAAFGHDHTIASHEITGFIDMPPGDLERAAIELTVRADSLAVVDRESQKDKVEIEKEMRETVLETSRYPTIRFKSTRFAAKPLGARTHDVVLTGVLELHGVKREITIHGRVGIDEGEIQARGELSLRQSDFGIRPTSAVAGTIKVDDEVKLEFDLRARQAR